MSPAPLSSSTPTVPQKSPVRYVPWKCATYPTPRASNVVLTEAGVAQAETTPPERSASNLSDLSVPQTAPQLTSSEAAPMLVSPPLSALVCVCKCVCMCVCLQVCVCVITSPSHPAAKLSWSPGSCYFPSPMLCLKHLITGSLSNTMISFQEFW